MRFWVRGFVGLLFSLLAVPLFAQTEPPLFPIQGYEGNPTERLNFCFGAHGPDPTDTNRFRYFSGQYHVGVDLRTSDIAGGGTIVSPVDGTLVYFRPSNPMNTFFVIRGNDGRSYVFAHVNCTGTNVAGQPICVTSGAPVSTSGAYPVANRRAVSRGDVLGSTFASSGVYRRHLHFGVTTQPMVDDNGNLLPPYQTRWGRILYEAAGMPDAAAARDRALSLGFLDPLTLFTGGNETGCACLSATGAAFCRQEGDGGVATSTNVQTTPNPSAPGQPVTVAVSVQASDGAIPPGAVEVRNGTDPIIQIQQASGSTELEVVAGGAHTCARTQAGEVWCWGSNRSGQVGIGASLETVLRPVQVQGLSSVLGVALGGDHSCAWTQGGTVFCWGANSYGQLGIGATGGQSSPVRIQGLSGVTAVASGALHTCARTQAGEVWCWGLNGDGQLGLGDTTRRLNPTRLPGLTGVTAVAAGGYHTCARTQASEVWCWGLNENGQLGLGDTTRRLISTRLPGLTGVTAVAAGAYHTCAISQTGSIMCWGRGSSGQIGVGDLNNRLNPVSVNGLPSAGDLGSGPIDLLEAVRPA